LKESLYLNYYFTTIQIWLACSKVRNRTDPLHETNACVYMYIVDTCRSSKCAKQYKEDMEKIDIKENSVHRITEMPNGKTQYPGIRCVILLQTFSENIMKIG
jgi:hypothetical protein